MSSPRPFEQSVLEEVEYCLHRHSSDSDSAALARIEILEGAASVAGGWSLEDFRRRHPGDYLVDTDAAVLVGAEIVTAIQRTCIPVALALSSLARPELEHTDRRKAGVYYTDFRLARYVAQQLIRPINRKDLVLDPAAGTGILLVGAGLVAAQSNRKYASHFVAEQACAADLAVESLRGARLALGSMTDSLDAIDSLDDRLRVQDSLLVGSGGWVDVAPNGFTVLVGNPPWEKLKASRHEYLQASGSDRHYGDDTDDSTELTRGVKDARDSLSGYTVTLAARFPVQAQGEPDLYKAFLALSFELTRADGQIGLLVPAGLIRSDGTRALRQLLLDGSSNLHVTVLDNRSRFFAIDTRFKFLAVHAMMAKAGRQQPLQLLHASGTEDGVGITNTVRIGRQRLGQVRPDLTVPEVRGAREWRLFTKMHDTGTPLGAPDGWWRPSIMREVDMTKDRPNFTRDKPSNSLAIIEGRMVHQYRTGAKMHVSGTGRRALWKANSPGNSEIAPQFWVSSAVLSSGARERSETSRVGFCDITGQTNERSMLASLIPAGVVCGNKVPTIAFGVPERSQEDTAFLWLAIANSLPFDWFLRRTITTTVNYFLLLSMPMPAGVTTQSLAGKRLIKLSRQVMQADTMGTAYNAGAVAAMRAEIDVRVAQAYGLAPIDLATMLRDFPLLDRGQPAINDEARSTVTADTVMWQAGALLGLVSRSQPSRVAAAVAAGAVAYIPADYSEVDAVSTEQDEAAEA
jgi:hypothetical protein